MFFSSCWQQSEIDAEIRNDYLRISLGVLPTATLQKRSAGKLAQLKN